VVVDHRTPSSRAIVLGNASLLVPLRWRSSNAIVGETRWIVLRGNSVRRIRSRLQLKALVRRQPADGRRPPTNATASNNCSPRARAVTHDTLRCQFVVRQILSVARSVGRSVAVFSSYFARLRRVCCTLGSALRQFVNVWRFRDFSDPVGAVVVAILARLS
jgi:hypothetical protein